MEATGHDGDKGPEALAVGDGTASMRSKHSAHRGPLTGAHWCWQMMASFCPLLTREGELRFEYQG